MRVWFYKTGACFVLFFKVIGHNQAGFRGRAIFAKLFLSKSSAVGSIKSKRADIHLCKLRDTPVARFFTFITL